MNSFMYARLMELRPLVCAAAIRQMGWSAPDGYSSGEKASTSTAKRTPFRYSSDIFSGSISTCRHSLIIQSIPSRDKYLTSDTEGTEDAILHRTRRKKTGVSCKGYENLALSGHPSH